MISSETAKKYKATIGIECHVQLKTLTKLFSAVANDAREAPPNTLISHIDLGMPGALPVLNASAVDLAIKAALALNTLPATVSTFDRKHYFYPDLPMGYQITQFYSPIITGGSVSFQVDGKVKTVNIHEAHLEADAGKSTHPEGKDYSLVDFNRAGTPLLEIVSEPEMHSPAEAKAYVKELYLLMRYADVSYANLFYGNMRFDVNVSVSKTDKLGTRTESKNLNSFKSVERAAEYEINRQIELLEKGELIIQETRGWDDTKQKTFSQRGKEEAHDYRYMPDPDIPPIEISQKQISVIKSKMPKLPSDLRQAFSQLRLDTSAVETLVEEIPAGEIIMNLLDKKTPDNVVRRIANWLVSDVQSVMSTADKSWDDLQLKQDDLVVLAEMTLGSKISSTGAKTVLLEMIETGEAPTAIAKTKNILQVSDADEIAKIVAQVLADNPKAAEDVKNGEIKAISYLVGQVMKLSQGKANPELAQKLIKKQLSLN